MVLDSFSLDSTKQTIPKLERELALAIAQKHLQTKSTKFDIRYIYFFFVPGEGKGNSKQEYDDTLKDLSTIHQKVTGAFFILSFHVSIAFSSIE